MMFMMRFTRLFILLIFAGAVLAACGGGGPLAVQKVTLSASEGGPAVTSFKPTDHIFYAAVELNRIDAGLTAKTVWTAVDTTNGQNIEIAQKEFSSLAANLIKAQVELPRDWPTGKYKLDIFLNGTPAKTVEFTVQ
jgi:ABC-type glycerol-3-phosphate transport system substrate-binding protein